MHRIRMLLFDIDGVVTDGRKYIDGNGSELKSIALKDLDALQLFKDAGYKIGFVTGEDTAFSRKLTEIRILDYTKIGCKYKEGIFHEVAQKYGVSDDEICYVGDGKYDIPALKRAGVAICPADAIEEAREVSDIVLKSKGGEGCLAEVYSLLRKSEREIKSDLDLDEMLSDTFRLRKRMEEHKNILDAYMEKSANVAHLNKAIGMIVGNLREGGSLFLCGNGGSAVDAQHLAAELVGRFYLERKALNAEALTENMPVLTSLPNDYAYDMVFSRQLEAKAHKGDILIGITTSGKSKNIVQAFQQAERMGVKTILMTGDILKETPILQYTDCLLSVPSQSTPRIQEMHILIGHIMCEAVERELLK